MPLQIHPIAGLDPPPIPLDSEPRSEPQVFHRCFPSTYARHPCNIKTLYALLYSDKVQKSIRQESGDGRKEQSLSGSNNLSLQDTSCSQREVTEQFTPEKAQWSLGAKLDIFEDSLDHDEQWDEKRGRS